MRLPRSFSLKLTRSACSCLALLAGWALLDRVGLTQAAAQAPAAGAAPAPAAAPTTPPGRGGGRGRALTPRPGWPPCASHSIV